MKKSLLLLVALVALFCGKSYAAMFEASPLPLQEASKNVVITFNADECNVEGLKNLSTDLYAHVGVYTTKSPNAWSHVKTKWEESLPVNCFKRVAANKYQLTIGDMRSYFGITDASEIITKICIIARTADGSAQTNDNFIEVEPAGFAMSFLTDPKNTVIIKATTINFTVNTSEAASIKLYVDGVVKKEANNATSLEYSQTFSTVGQANEVKVTATKGSETITKVANVFYVGSSAQGNYPGGVPKQGAVRNSDGSVTFCLAAPQKSSVVLVGSWDNYKTLNENLMKYQDYQGFRYFWTTVKGLDNETAYPYYYLVDGKYKVGDPYAKLVLDCHADKWLGNEGEDPWPGRPVYPYDIMDDVMLAVYQGNINDYNWKVKDFAAKNPIAVTNRDALVIYELLFRDFTGTDNKPDGTVRKAIEQFDYIKNLGVTAVELMPIMQFDGNNSWGYNTNFFMAPDKSYGSPDDYKEFIDLCHQNGIAVILDIVFNHTPGLHPWWQMYEEGTSPFYNATAPHGFGVYNDIKQDYGLVEKHWIDVLTYWLTEYKVDGFRFDLVKGLGDTNSYGGGDMAYNDSRLNRMNRLYQAMKKVNPHVIHINEAFVGYEEEVAMGNYGMIQWNNQNGQGGTYAKALGADLQYFNAQKCSRPAGSTVDYAESHDEQRLGWYAKNEGDHNSVKSSKSGRCKRVGSVYAQMLMQPGPKMIWQYGELANEENTKKPEGDNNTDPKEVGYQYRTEPDRNALYNSIAQINWLRRLNPELFGANSTIVYNNFGNSNSVRSIRVTNGNKEVVAFINPGTSGDETITASTTVLNASNCQLVSEARNAKSELTGSGRSVSVELPSNSYAVYATTQVADVEDVVADVTENSFRVYTVAGSIVIEGEYDYATVYDMTGRLVEAGSNIGNVNVAAGLYVVDVDGNATKLLVR